MPYVNLYCYDSDYKSTFAKQSSKIVKIISAVRF